MCGGDDFHATNSIGAFGGFPFIEYVCGHRDADGRVRSGIAFHGPITSHVIGFDRGARGTPVTVVAGYDSLLGKIIDVDYPSSGRTRPSASESVVFPIWQAVKRRGDGSTALDFPQWACETSRCAGMPANARDPFTGAAL